MSSTSLSSVPAHVSPWRIQQPTIRPAYLNLARPPLDHPSSDLTSLPSAALPPSESTGGSSRPSKRPCPRQYLAPPSPDQHRSKRVREATPICQDDESTSQGAAGEGGPGASAAPYSTTMTVGPSSLAEQLEEGDVRIVGGSEEEGEREGSVLFSERERLGDKPEILDGRRQGMAEEDGEMDDEDEDEDGVEFRTEATETIGATGGEGVATTGEFLPEEGGEAAEQDDEEDEQEEEGVAEEDAFNPETDEGADEEDVDAPLAMHAGPSRIRGLPDGDRMSRFIERSKTSSRASVRGHDEYQAIHHPNEHIYLDDELVNEDGEPRSYHSGDTDEYEMDHRPVLERTAVKRDIRRFADGLQALKDRRTGEWKYQVVDRLGEGTFSSVYLALDRYHNLADNTYWTEGEVLDDPEMCRMARNDVPVALKKILVTSSPARIENELHILESLRGCRNVSQLITAFREEDQVIIVLPFHLSDDFRHFYRHMDPHHIRLYMRSLFRGLKDIHARGIVHRDVKPANFLFCYESGEGVLCDFGLAERYTPPRKPTCQHAPATLSTLHGARCKTTDTATVEQSVYDARKRAKLGEGRVGFLQDDKRPAVKTNRAGTRGFRAPEVLLKCPDQSVAIDVWSAGIMLLSILTHKFPVFNSSDDIEALMEIAAIFGRAAMERCAMLHNRTIISNVPTLDTAPMSVERLVQKLNPHIYTPPLAHPSAEDARAHIEAIDGCMDLCGKLLRLDPTKRLSADAALRHAFLRGDDEEEDEGEEGREILAGTEGKCGKLHSVEGGRHQAYFSQMIQDLQFGQGIPPSRESLCPEHDHWQQRIGFNPLAICKHFPDPEQGEEGGVGEGDEAGDEEGSGDGGEVGEKSGAPLKGGLAVAQRDRRAALGEKSLNVLGSEGNKLSGLGRFVKT